MKSIVEAFRLMRLSSQKDRDRLIRLGKDQIEEEQSESYVFIKAGSNSESLELGEEVAELE